MNGLINSHIINYNEPVKKIVCNQNLFYRESISPVVLELITRVGTIGFVLVRKCSYNN